MPVASRSALRGAARRARPSPLAAPLLGAALLSLAAAAIAAPIAAQGGYQQPPAPIARILDAPRTPSVIPAPDRERLLLLDRPGYPSIAEVAAPELRLAGMRFDPASNGPSRGNGTRALSLLGMKGGEPTPISIPWPAGTDTTGGPIGSVSWSPDGNTVFFTVTTESGIYAFAADAASASARQLSTRRLNGVLGNPCDWLGAEPALVCKLIPADRGPAPVQPTVPTGPIIQETEGGAAERVATYQDLLKTPHDADLFAYYATSQLARVGLDGSVQEFGPAGIHAGTSASPDGRYVLATTMSRPFSYVVPASFFPNETAIWSLDGTKVRVLHSEELRERVPWGGRDAAQPGPRGIRWRNDVAAAVVWTEALAADTQMVDGKRDKIVQLDAPFAGEARELARTTLRAGGITWGNANLAILREGWRSTRTEKTWAIDPSDPSRAPRLLFEQNTEDRYGDVGEFLTTQDARGQSVLLTTPDGRFAFLSGTGASPEGDRPFLDRYELASGRTERLFRSAAPYYEQPLGILDTRGERLLTRRESTSEPPNYFVRELRRRSAPIALTSFADPAPQFAGVTQEVITYTRKDGVQLSAKLFLPPGYDKAKDGPLPFFLWAYPREFKSSDAASQVQGSPYRFVRPGGSSHLFALLQGYGVLDDPAMPIIGEGDAEPNDTYVEQLVASAEAAVDAIVERGVADRDRIAVGGHSYGAFMTANLLAHSRLFRAGIARSGAYNRTLTPFGFQAEPRTFWEAPEVYLEMSPFMRADKVKDPILLIHGMADNNTGTFPIQSERFYAALKGNGGTVRYVQLPAESHGYAARESIGHTLAEMMGWLDRHVKPSRATATMQP